MPGLIDELITVLEKQAENYNDLLGLSYEKKDVIVNNDLETLQKITALENTFIGKNINLDKKRALIIKDIALVLNKRPEELTLSTLGDLIKTQKEYANFNAVSDTIKKTVDELKAINELNKVLISNSIEYIDFSMNLIRGSLSGAPSFYSADGQEMQSGRVFFDAKQ